MFLEMHVYPPPLPMDRAIKPIPRSLHHQSPQTPTRPSRTLSVQSSTLTPTATSNDQLVLPTRPFNSVRRRLSDADDPFAPEKEGMGDKQVEVHKTTQMQIEVGYFRHFTLQTLT